MSIEEENERQRGVKLCQLVYDRQIDSDIGYEVRKLLEEGVLIDFKDQNRNKKTVIHLAVEKRDIICVKFLLQFKPNLAVKDGNGKTPVELAELHGDQTILNILLNSTVDVVDESFVEVIDFEGLTRHKIEANKSRPTFKVLKLTNCPSVEDVWMTLNEHGYTTVFNESSHLFFIAIESKETNIQNDGELMEKVLNFRRPMIVQLSTANNGNTKIYFKDDLKKFMELNDTPQITQEEFNKSVELEEKTNLKLLVAALRSNLFGSFNGDLLNAKLNTNEDRTEAVNKFAKRDALCHRYFKLFYESQPQIERIVAALSFKGDQSLLAFLDLPFEPKGNKLKLDETQKDILGVVDSSGCNLLMMAVEQSNLNAVKLLLRCGSDYNHSDNYDNRVSDICWQMKDLNCLAELIEADSPYPINFRIDEVDESPEAEERINEIIRSTNSHHENIEQGKTEEVKEFITCHPHIKHAYDTNNKCALTVALQSEQVDIHSLLRSKGFDPGADDKYYDALKNFEYKELITNSHRKYFREAFNEPHLKRLLRKSRLSFGSKDRSKCSAIIRKMFDELNEIDEVIPILQICSLSDKLEIVFDFNCNSVADMDPTAGSNTLGIVYPIDGFIYVGAKNHETEFCKVIGTLIHELTHYAMKLTNENDCKPYNVDDIESENRFEDILRETKKICDANPSTDSIVVRVFECYVKEVWHQELIVRVPQLLAHYKVNPKALKAAERNTPELFHFYRDKTLKGVETQSKVWLQKYFIRKINNQTGISRKIESLNVNFENVEINLKPSVNVITSNAPKLTLAILHQALPADSHIFVTLEQVAIGNILDRIVKVNAKGSSTALIVDCIGLAQKYLDSLRKLLKDMKDMKTILLVMTEAESSKVKGKFPKIELKTFDHKWDELTGSSKVHLLDQIVKFQGVEMKLNELVKPSSKAMNFLPLGELVESKDFKIGNELRQTTHKFYVPRKFIKKDQEKSTREANAKNFEELLQTESKTSAMIISDDAGSGKSVTLFEVAKSLHGTYPDRWVLFVDLKRHIDAFKGIEDCENIESFEDFIVHHILRDESEFDRELFLQMFRAEKTFVLFDGFDEISPNYIDLLLHVLNLSQPGPGNQLFITSRPHLEAELEGALGSFVFKLEKLDEESQINFLTKYFESVAFESEEDFEVLSKRVLEKFSEIESYEFIGLPLLMHMTAEIFSEGIKGNIMNKVDSSNVASLFKEFVDKYFARWTKSENEISLNENVEFVRSGGILEVHHKIALNYIFGDEFAVSEVDHRDSEKIARVGLIQFDKTSKTFQFIHQTFAEYFVADFICFHLERKSRNPSHDCQKTLEVLSQLVEIGREDSPFFKDYSSGGVVETFLNQTLGAMKLNLNEVSCQSLAKCFCGLVKSQSCFHILRESCEVEGENIFNIILSVVKHVDKDFLLKMLESRDRYDRTALHYAVRNQSSKSVSTLCNIIETIVDNPKRIFQQECDYGNVLFSTLRNENRGVLTALCESLKTLLTREEIIIMMQKGSLWGGRCIIHAAVQLSNDEAFNELLSLLSEYVPVDELKTFLRAVDSLGRNCFHEAVGRSTKRILKSLINFSKGIFATKEYQQAYFQQPSHRRRNFFHLAARNRNEGIFQTIIESVCDVFSNDDFRRMLMEKDSFGSNVLHLVAINTAKSTEINLKALSSLLRKFLSDEDLRSLLLQENEKVKNCFCSTATNAATNIQEFRNVFGNLCPQGDQPRLLEESSH